MIQSVGDILSKSHLISAHSTPLIENMLMFLGEYPLKTLYQEHDIVSLMRLLSKIFFLTAQELQDKILSLYEKFVTKLTEQRHFECNNFAGMLYNMKAFMLLNYNQDIGSIRSILKRAGKYDEEGTNCDPSLLAINQNNLAVLYMQVEQYQKSFLHASRAYELIKNHLLVMKKNKDPSLKNKVLIFVNSCYLIKESLNGRMKIEQPNARTKKQYLEYIELFHSQGFKKAKKYLGTDSYIYKLMEKRHTPVADEYFTKDLLWKHELTLVSISHSDQSRQRLEKMTEYLNQKVNPRLDSLLNTILRSQEHRKTIPAVVIPPPPPPRIPTPPPSPKIQPEPEPEPQPEPDPEVLFMMTKHFPQSKRFSIKIKILKGKTYRLGKTTIQIIQSDKVVASEVIQQQLLHLITAQLCRDCAPYDTHIYGCSPQEFLEYFLMPNIYLQQSKVSIQPHCKGLFRQKTINFFGFQCSVFVNHIRGNEFRISISPLQMTQTFHIDIVVNENIMDQLIKDYSENYILDPRIQNLWRICKGQPIVQSISKEVIVTQHIFSNSDLLENQIPVIIEGFEKFMSDHKFTPSNLKYLFKHKKKTYLYLKYKIQEWRTGKGCYYGVRNLEKNKTIDVVLENRHLTFCPTGKIRAKGYHCVDYSYLYFEFGVEECTKYQIDEVIEVFAMVSEMYHLFTYEYELERDEKELYGENAIRVGKLIGRTGKRISTLVDDRYPTTITAQVVTVNNQLPLGVKVNIWSEELCLENGFFLRLDKRKWLKERPRDLNTSLLKQSKMSSNRSSTSLFSNRKVKQEPPALLNYLFNPILTTVGFNILIKQLKYYENKQYFGLGQTFGNPKFGKLQDFIPIHQAQELFDELNSKKNNSLLNQPKLDDIPQQS